MLNIIQKTIFVRNVPESELANILKDWELGINKNIKLAYLPSPGLVRLCLSSIGMDKLYLEEIINLELEKLARIIDYDNSEIDLNLPCGVYILTIYSEGKFKTQKLIVGEE